MSERKDIVRAVLDAIARRDAAVLSELFDDDVVWWTPVSAPVEHPLVGRETVVGLAVGGTGLFRPDTTSWEELGLFEEGDTVVAHVIRRSLTGKGAPYENEYLFRFDIPDGRVTEAWENTDTAHGRECFTAEPSAATS